MAKKNTSFLVYAKITVDTSLCIQAESLEDAIKKGRELTVTDFFEINGDHLDSELKIVGVIE
jgi:hypothetical protein